MTLKAIILRYFAELCGVRGQLRGQPTKIGWLAISRFSQEKCHEVHQLSTTDALCSSRYRSFLFAYLLLFAVRYWMTENMRVCLHICCCFRGTMWDLEHVHKTTWSGLYMLQCRRMTTPPGIKLSVTARLWRHRLALTESLIPGGDLVRGHCSMCRPAQVAYGTCPPRVTQQIACWMFRKAISNNSQ